MTRPGVRLRAERGLVAQLVSAPPCHGGGRGFKSRRGRGRSVRSSKAGPMTSRGSVAQLVERSTENRKVTGSTPVGATAKGPELTRFRAFALFSLLSLFAPLRRDRSYSASRSVRFRLEIGRTPRRDRSTSGSRSVAIRTEIGPHPRWQRFSTVLQCGTPTPPRKPGNEPRRGTRRALVMVNVGPT